MDDSNLEVKAPLPATDATLLGAEVEFPHSALLARARGAILGAALGDALGLQVDGDDLHTIADRHPDRPNYPYHGAYGGYPPGDWTDATDLAVLTARTLRSFFTKASDEPVLDLAARIDRWYKSGFPELGDISGVHPESVVLRALTTRGFVTNPLDVACDIKGYKAENGAMTRSICCAFVPFSEVWTDTLARVTHSDPRALACASTFTALIKAAALTPVGSPLLASSLREPITAGCSAITEEPRRIDFMARLTDTTTLDAIMLDERDRRSYAVKTLSCVMWALRRAIHTTDRSPEFFKETLRNLAAKGGDASANCCAVGAVLGALLGADNLPQDWLSALPNRSWLETEISEFSSATRGSWFDSYSN